HGIEHQRCRHQAHREQGEQHHVVLRHRRGGGADAHRAPGVGLFRHGRHHAVLLPNRPAGFSRSTMAMMMKITVAEASGYNTLVNPSISPRPKPVTVAPRIEPMPTITTTANPTRISSAPMFGLTV